MNPNQNEEGPAVKEIRETMTVNFTKTGFIYVGIPKSFVDKDYLPVFDKCMLDWIKDSITGEVRVEISSKIKNMGNALVGAMKKPVSEEG